MTPFVTSHGWCVILTISEFSRPKYGGNAQAPEGSQILDLLGLLPTFFGTKSKLLDLRILHFFLQMIRPSKRFKGKILIERSETKQ